MSNLGDGITYKIINISMAGTKSLNENHDDKTNLHRHSNNPGQVLYSSYSAST